MFSKLCSVFILAGYAVCAAATAETTHASALSASAIVDKNVAARGGLQAWRSVQTLSLSGKLGAGGNQRAALRLPNPTRVSVKQSVAPRPAEEVQLPFVMDLARPRKMRFELQFKGKTAVQVYDGANGWKLRPFLGRSVVEPYTAEEMKIARTQADLDGPLVDYAAKGTRVELEGSEKVEDRDTYKLKLTMKSGEAIHVWVDAATFLETKIEGQPRTLDGVEHPVEIYFRDYRQTGQLQIPYVMETKVLPAAHAAAGRSNVLVPTERITIEKVEINPKLDQLAFAKPLVDKPSGK